MRILQTDFQGDHNVGLFGRANNSICLLSNFVSEKNLKKIEDVLKVQIINTTLANTDFIGMLCGMNSNGIVLPNIVNSDELKKFHSITKKFGMNLLILKTKYTAIGNLVLCNDNGAVVSKYFSKKDKKKIEDCLDVEVEHASVAGMNTVGSCGVATNSGCLLHRDATEDEIKIVQSMLKVNTDIGTANFGSPFVGCCIIANAKGVIVGQSTTGPEANRILEALNLL
jgi:translation initiation factor 6